MKYNIVTYTEEKSVKKEIISNGNHKYHYRPKLDIKIKLERNLGNGWT